MKINSFAIACTLSLIAHSACANGTALILEGVGPSDTVEDLRAKFPGIKCEKSQVKFGQRILVSELCITQKKFQGNPAEYRITLDDDRVSGLGIVVPLKSGAKEFARSLLGSMKSKYGNPQRESAEVLQLKRVDSEVLAFWSEQSTATIAISVCDLGGAFTSMACPTDSVTIMSTYRRKKP